MKRIDVLDLEYSSRGRDIDIVEPTLSYLEFKYNLKIERRWLFNNPLWDLIRLRPKILVVANSVGSFEHFCVVKFAHYWGIKVVTFVSEGDYLDTSDSISSFFWGWNKDFYKYEDLNLQWSQRCIDLINKDIPYEQRNNTIFRLSGATGFDKYKLLQFMDKNAFLKKFSFEKFKKVVGVAGWGFDHFWGDYYERHKTEFIYSDDDLKIIRESLRGVSEGYEYIVRNNPDILFILKYHPMTINEMYSEFYGLSNYQNVLVLHTEENIYDVINVSDIWIAFESTTCLEGWLMDKTTLLFNPAGDNFERSIISKGSYIVKEKEQLSFFLHEFFDKGKLDCFEDLASKRRYIISQVIGFDDGRSFVRASSYIKNLLDDDSKHHINLWKLLLLSPTLFKHSIRILLCKYKIFSYIPGIKQRINKAIEFRKGLFSNAERQHNAGVYKHIFETKKI